jgi:predicted metallo-beta-lactamase superfamily hydrolase
MCTYVKTPDLKVLLDAGVSLAPNRFGFPPHPREYEAIAECREKIAKASEKAEVVTLSHYHFDHHTPSYVDWFCNWSSPDVAKQIYDGKIVLVKSYRENINFSQRRRGWLFKKTGGKHAERLEIADGKIFRFGDTQVRFSEPVFHGPIRSTLGWVLMTSIEYDDEKMLFASDVQGSMYNLALETILADQPQLIIIGGPPVYLGGFRVKEEHIALAMQNLERIVAKIPVMVLEHHLLRDPTWREVSLPIIDAAKKHGHKVVTAAEFVGKENNVMEFRRRQLFESEPPDVDFERWMRLPMSKRKLAKPPI